SGRMDPRIQRNTATSGTLVLRENPDADVPGCNADDEGENDRGLTTTDTKTRSLNQAPPVRSSSGYYNLKGTKSPTSISTGIKPACSLRSVSSTQASCPSQEPSKPRHSLKNRGASERERERAKTCDLPVELDTNLVLTCTIEVAFTPSAAGPFSFETEFAY